MVLRKGCVIMEKFSIDADCKRAMGEYSAMVRAHNVTVPKCEEGTKLLETAISEGNC